MQKPTRENVRWGGRLTKNGVWKAWGAQCDSCRCERQKRKVKLKRVLANKEIQDAIARDSRKAQLLKQANELRKADQKAKARAKTKSKKKVQPLAKQRCLVKANTV